METWALCTRNVSVIAGIFIMEVVMQKINDILRKAMEIIVDRKFEEHKKKQTSIRPVVAYKSLGDNMYLIALDGYEYKVWNGLGVDLKPCQKAWLMIPHGRMEDMFICGIRK